MAIRTYGPNAVDWEQRINLDRLRTERLARLREELEQSDLGALLTFDFSNIRYMDVGRQSQDLLDVSASMRTALLVYSGITVKMMIDSDLDAQLTSMWSSVRKVIAVQQELVLISVEHML